jgi:hypothetical protein
MKLDKGPFLANMNTVKLNGKNVLVQPSQAKSTKGKEVVIGEDRQPRMIRPKNPEIGWSKKNERSKQQSHPKATFDISWLNIEMAALASGVMKTGPSDFPGSGQYFYGRKLIQLTIQDTTGMKFRRMESLSIGVLTFLMWLRKRTELSM